MKEKSGPLVSIIIPAYNQEPRFLKQCVDSAISQTYTNVEIILSDNHSTNETKEMFEAYRQQGVKVVRPPEHVRMLQHFQWAAEQSTGEFISFVPSDDWLENECIEELIKPLIEHPNAVMSFCNVKQYTNDSTLDFINLKPGISPSEDEIQAYIRISKLKGCMLGCIFRRSVFQKAKGLADEDIQLSFDRWIFLKMAMYGDGAYLDKPLAIYRNENPLRKSRLLVYSQDVVNFFEAVERDYLDKIRNGKAIVQKEKNKMAYSFLGPLIQNYKSGDVSEDEYAKTVANLKKLSHGGIVRSMINLYEKKKLFGPLTAFFYLSTKYTNASAKIKTRLRSLKGKA